MRFVTYQAKEGPRAAVVSPEDPRRLIDLNAADASLPVALKALLALGPAGIERAGKVISKGKPLDRASVRLLAPIPDPQKIICVGLNYADHARETGKEPPPEPIIFNKFPSAVIADGDTIILPEASHHVDYEGELVAVVGSAGPTGAWSIAGYCCGNDVSARDWQTKKPGGQWLLGKSFDTFAPFGPELVTADEVGDPGNLKIQFRLSGRVMQDSSTSQLIFPVDTLIKYISQVCTLSSGDVLFTGTPPGVGVARQPPVYLQDGDVCEVEIEKIGVLKNPVTRPARG